MLVKPVMPLVIKHANGHDWVKLWGGIDESTLGKIITFEQQCKRRGLGKFMFVNEGGNLARDPKLTPVPRTDTVLFARSTRPMRGFWTEPVRLNCSPRETKR